MSAAAPTEELLATCWTSAGPALPGGDGQRSPIPVMERVEAVAAAGFAGMGLVLADLRGIREGIGFAALRARAAELGVTRVEVELLEHWWPGGDPRWREDWDLLREAAVALRSPVIKIGPPPGAPIGDLSALVPALRSLAREAEAIGTRLALEPLPFAAVESLPRGSALIAAVDRPQIGLAVDLWHVFRAGTSLDELARTLDPATVLAVELCDARRDPAPGADLFEDTRDHRCYPGEGELDVEGFVRTLRGLGVSGPWGVEILSHEHRAAPLRDGLLHAAVTARRCLDRALDRP